jgi:hypothetical protein
VLVLLLVIWRAYEFRLALLWPVTWIGLLIAPVLPVFASSHHLYLPSAGAVLLMAAGLAALGGIVRRRTGPISPLRGVTCGFVLVAHAIGLSLFTWAMGFAYDAGTRTEDIVVNEILRRSKPIRDGDHLFFINFPMVAYYAVPALETGTGRKHLQGHVLTFSPDMVRMSGVGEVEIIGERVIRVRAPAGQPYLAGVAGKALLDILGLPGVPPAGQTVPAGLFTVTPTNTTADGIEEAVFTFDQPVRSPNYHFYFGSPQFLAYPLELIAPQTRGQAERAGGERPSEVKATE